MQTTPALTLYYTTDVHGYFFPTSYGDRAEREMGLFRCAPAFQKDGDTLVIDCGDILQGSAFSYYCESVLGSAKTIAEAMNRCGYDYVVPGNHDFNYGLPYLRGYLGALDAGCVAENVRNPDGGAPYPYVIHTLANGLRVGIVGLVTAYVTVWERPEHLAGVLITDPFEAARRALASLSGQVDLTLGVYHGGFERDLDSGALLSDTGENAAYRICRELSFDILLTGHQHMPTANRTLFGTHVVQCRENAREFACLEAVRGEGGFQITSRLIPARFETPPALAAPFLPVERAVQAWLDEPAGRLERDLLPESKLAMAVNGSPIADFFHQVQLFYSGAQISVTSLANELGGFRKDVTRRDIIASYPYPNTLVTVAMTGAELKAALERTAAYFAVAEDGSLAISDAFLHPKEEHYNYDFYAGITYRIDASRPVGARVILLEYEGGPVAETDVFTVCVNNYRASGAGGYSMYDGLKPLREINREMTDLILGYFERFPEVTLTTRHGGVVVPSASV